MKKRMLSIVVSLIMISSMLFCPVYALDGAGTKTHIGPVSDWEDLSMSFTDVHEKDWYTNAVKYVVYKKIMQGTSGNTFAPSMKLSRAMLVQILYNLENRPSAESKESFQDVHEKDWFANAVFWAQKNGIVKGITKDYFKPEQPVTREQAMTILYRYFKFENCTTLEGDDRTLSRFSDAEKIHDWALIPVRWAVNEGMIEGISATTLDPTGDMNRAMIASIIQRMTSIMSCMKDGGHAISQTSFSTCDFAKTDTDLYFSYPGLGIYRYDPAQNKSDAVVDKGFYRFSEIRGGVAAYDLQSGEVSTIVNNEKKPVCRIEAENTFLSEKNDENCYSFYSLIDVNDKEVIYAKERLGAGDPVTVLCKKDIHSEKTEEVFTFNGLPVAGESQIGKGFYRNDDTVYMMDSRNGLRWYNLNDRTNGVFSLESLHLQNEIVHSVFFEDAVVFCTSEMKGDKLYEMSMADGQIRAFTGSESVTRIWGDEDSNDLYIFAENAENSEPSLTVLHRNTGEKEALSVPDSLESATEFLPDGDRGFFCLPGAGKLTVMSANLKTGTEMPVFRFIEEK